MEQAAVVCGRLAGWLATATATLIVMLDLDAEGERDTYVY